MSRLSDFLGQGKSQAILFDTNSFSWVVPPNLTAGLLSGCGGGCGGGGAAIMVRTGGNYASGNGGGSGYSMMFLPVNLVAGATCTIVIGAGGTQGANTSTTQTPYNNYITGISGNSGGMTSFNNGEVTYRIPGGGFASGFSGYRARYYQSALSGFAESWSGDAMTPATPSANIFAVVSEGQTLFNHQNVYQLYPSVSPTIRLNFTGSTMGSSPGLISTSTSTGGRSIFAGSNGVASGVQYTASGSFTPVAEAAIRSGDYGNVVWNISYGNGGNGGYATGSGNAMVGVDPTPGIQGAVMLTFVYPYKQD